MAREEVVDSRLRRYYELTDAGAEELDGEVARLEANAAAGRNALRLRSAQLSGGVA
ncbi:hypothetical protein ACLRGI_21575 [Paenarthrobacter nitroguajacolicus]|uniref:hypothetical protein n=1 Tax=Paenarthrobacter nitroguajacolicus TaxID=211146 RepID=UPI003AE73B34